MCGIVGIVSDHGVAPILVQCLERVEYRGYDSCGVATLNKAKIEIRKGVGAVGEVSQKHQFSRVHGAIGIGHTRWATHGGVSEQNAHPHLSCDGRFAVVHNGIFTNHRMLRRDLEDLGHVFVSATDSEALCHLLEDLMRDESSVEAAFVSALKRLEGSFAIAMISSIDPNSIFCAREKSPLILGIDSGRYFVGSDINAFLPFTRRAIVLEDGEYAVLSPHQCRVSRIDDSSSLDKRPFEIDWQPASSEKVGRRHYMEKEIWDQPAAIAGALDVSQHKIELLASRILQTRNTLLVGVGTTYYVALYGQYLLSLLAAEPSQAISADEFPHLALPGDRTTMLAISQSGETFDTLESIRQANAAGAFTAAIVNMPGSTMGREVREIILQNSGPEICVISTKAALAQMVLLSRLAVEIAFLKRRITEQNKERLLKELGSLPELLEDFLINGREAIHHLAVKYHLRRNWFFLGRSLYAAIAFEAALKMKEVTYIHAEGMQAGFLKHGTLSLIDEETPSLFLIPPATEKNIYQLTISNVEEVRARKGPVIAFGYDQSRGLFDDFVRLPEAPFLSAPLLQLVAAQLLAYETAVLLGRNVDRPRSLAKSITVS